MNTNCNLDCPVCFADSGHQPDGYSITLEQCERMLDVYVAAEGEPEVIMFSGGEPTIHLRILDFIDAARCLVSPRSTHPVDDGAEGSR